MYRRNQSKISIHLWRYIMYCNCYVILIIEGISVGRRHMRLLIRLRRNPELWFWVLLVPLGSLSLKDMTGAPPTTRHGHLRHQRHEGLILRRCHVQKLNCFAGFLWLPGAIEGFGKKPCRWGKKRRATLMEKLWESWKCLTARVTRRIGVRKFQIWKQPFHVFFILLVFFHFQGAKRWPHQMCRDSSSSCWEAEIWNASNIH